MEFVQVDDSRFAAEHTQPGPSAEHERTPRPEAESVTAIVPAAGAVPTFVTLTVYVSSKPAPKFPCGAADGQIGNGSATMNVTESLVPPGVETLTASAPSGASLPMFSFAVASVEL